MSDHIVRLDKPLEEPVTLAEAKAHLGVVDGSEDRYIYALLESATLYAEQYMERECRATEMELWADAFVRTQTIAREVETIDEVAYRLNGSYAVVAPSVYELVSRTWDADLVLARSEKWPTDGDPVTENGVRITFTAKVMTDLPTAESVILRHISFMYGQQTPMVTDPNRIETNANLVARTVSAVLAGDVNSGLDPMARP